MKLAFLVSLTLFVLSTNVSAGPRRGGGDECELSFKAAAYRVKKYLNHLPLNERTQILGSIDEKSFNTAILMPIAKKQNIFVGGDEKTAAYNYDEKNYELNCERFKKASFADKLGISWHEVNRAMGRETDYEESHKLYNKIVEEMLAGTSSRSAVFDEQYVETILDIERQTDALHTHIGKAFDLTRKSFLDSDGWVLKGTALNLAKLTELTGSVLQSEVLRLRWSFALASLDNRLGNTEKTKAASILSFLKGSKANSLAESVIWFNSEFFNSKTLQINLGNEGGVQDMVYIQPAVAQKTLSDIESALKSRVEIWAEIYKILGNDLGNNNSFENTLKFNNPATRSIVFLGSRDETGYETAQIVAGLFWGVEIFNVTDIDTMNNITLGKTPEDGSDKTIKMIVYSWGGKNPVYLTKRQAEDIKFVSKILVQSSR